MQRKNDDAFAFCNCCCVNCRAQAAAGIIKDEHMSAGAKRPKTDKAIDTYSLLKSMQQRARKITPTPYKLYMLNNNIRCALKQVYLTFLYVRCLPLLLPFRNFSLLTPEATRCCKETGKLVVLLVILDSGCSKASLSWI